MTSRLPRTTGTLLLAVATALTAAGCTGRNADPAPPASVAPTPSASTAPTSPTGDALAEREAFFDVQGRPVDGQLPTPQTPEQEAFLTEQRAFVQSQGGQWDEFYDGIALAVTLDACETSILNGHALTPETARAHIESSPLISQVAGGDAAAVEGLASIMVFGTRFVCPGDAAQWESAFTALYG